MANPCWGRPSHDRDMHQSGVLRGWGTQSLLRSTCPWRRRHTIPDEVDSPIWKKCTRVVPCDIDAPSLLRSHFPWPTNPPERCAIPVEVDFPMMGKCNSMVFFEVDVQSLLRSSFQWKWKAPEWCSVSLRSAIPVEVDHPMTGKCNRVVPCDFKVHNPYWGRPPELQSLLRSTLPRVWAIFVCDALRV